MYNLIKWKESLRPKSTDIPSITDWNYLYITRDTTFYPSQNTTIQVKRSVIDSNFVNAFKGSDGAHSLKFSSEHDG